MSYRQVTRSGLGHITLFVVQVFLFILVLAALQPVRFGDWLFLVPMVISLVIRHSSRAMSHYSLKCTSNYLLSSSICLVAWSVHVNGWSLILVSLVSGTIIEILLGAIRRSLPIFMDTSPARVLSDLWKRLNSASINRIRVFPIVAWVVTVILCILIVISIWSSGS